MTRVILLLMFPALSLAALPPWAVGPFERPAVAGPVVAPEPKSTFVDPIGKSAVHWEALHTFNPAAIVYDGKVCVLYRAEDDSGKMAIGGHTSRLGLATSDDGVHFNRNSEPVFFPDNDEQKDREWPGGCEDPRLIAADDGRFVLTYTQYNRQQTFLAIATSTDLHHWTKYGPAFGGVEKYAKMNCKSGAMVGAVKGDNITAVKINGHYWMYWGEGDIHLATSDDLIHWTPVERADGKLKIAIGRRTGMFDSALSEAGPPAILTD